MEKFDSKTKVEKFDSKTKDEVQRLYEKLKNENYKKRESKKTEREETEDKPDDWRSEYSRDYARILYSSSFRRLQGKMQILGIETTAFYRNRLTHSLEVSQIARSIAKLLAYKCKLDIYDDDDIMYNDDDLWLLDAAALAHDIGHSAFGHKGERVLDEIAKIYGLRFESNAQNYRVLRELERHGLVDKGLHLTYRTLLAINKYIVSEEDPKLKEEGSKQKFMYQDDYMYLSDFRKDNNLDVKERTLDAQIIELADDIAYAVHDLEDGLSQGMFTIDEIEHQMCSSDKEDEANKEFSKLIENVRKELGGLDQLKENEISNIQEYSHLFRKRLTSLLTNSLINSIEYGKPLKASDGQDEQDALILKEPYNTLCDRLKKTIYKAATRKSSIALYELKGEIILKTLFNIYVDSKINRDGSLLPPDYRDNMCDECKKKEEKEKKNLCEKCKCEKCKKVRVRYIIDYLAGMMDTYAISEFEHFTGIKYDQIDVTKIPNIEKKYRWRLKSRKENF